jgi:hypothetical protein|tara:strand:+ start:431 stop:1786 length:1356 start_codon:yes stop_codon:yes gene_type:complete
MAKLSQFAQKSLRDSFKDASGMLTGFGQGIPPVQPAQQFNTGGGLGKSVRNIAGILTGKDFSTDEEIYKDKLESATGTREILVVQRDYARSRGDTAGALEAQMKIDALDEQRKTKVAEQTRDQSLRTSLVDRNKAIGGPEERNDSIANATGEMLVDIRKEIRAEEIAAIAKNEGKAGRIALGRQAGLTKEQVKQYSNLNDETFAKVLSGEEADSVAYQDAQGKVEIYRENKYGMIADTNADGVTTWIEPSDKKLVEAPTVTKTYNSASDLTSQLTKAAVPDFQELTKQARDAVETLISNKEGRDLLASNEYDITGGPLGEFKLQALELAKSFGASGSAIDSADNVQAFMATRVREIGTIIKMFGSGTGLSDKDADLAKKAAAGEMELTIGNIRRLMEFGDRQAKRKLALHKKVYDSFVTAGVGGQALVAFEVDSSGLSSDLTPQAQTYLRK